MIPLGPKSRAFLEGLLRADPDDYLFDPREAVAEHHARRGRGPEVEADALGAVEAPCEPGGRPCPPLSPGELPERGDAGVRPGLPPSDAGQGRHGRLSEDQRAELLAWRKAHRWHPNQLRHTVATEVRARFGLEAAQAVLGHAKADVTQVYAERDLSKAAEVMRQIG